MAPAALVLIRARDARRCCTFSGDMLHYRVILAPDQGFPS